MPLFRRRRASRPEMEFTVGIHDNRVVVGVPGAGIAFLPELTGYVASVTGGAAAPHADGRDSVAVLSAKMDYAELVDDAVSVVTLAFEELAERGAVDATDVPPQPELPPMPQKSGSYEYIQASHARAQVRMTWLERADVVLRAHGVAVLHPLPDAQPHVRPPR